MPLWAIPLPAPPAPPPDPDATRPEPPEPEGDRRPSRPRAPDFTTPGFRVTFTPPDCKVVPLYTVFDEFLPGGRVERRLVITAYHSPDCPERSFPLSRPFTAF